ncbi:hypothetical protein DPMN_132646 [Dreissena polymorpha]|uniref:Uncharacterized protein n=2 Tax=Dreissena polymorpha TaxID=45954 RepID=A0A9D4FYQ7_DREPO|nr:hypothetical protein DPMN_132646 [Dreissena polymorpha]
MQETLHDHHTSISIAVTISNLRFAYDFDLMGGTNTELQNLISRPGFMKEQKHTRNRSER